MTAKDLLERARRLPARERGRIVRELIASLDEGGADDSAEVEDEWGRELEERAVRAKRGEPAGRSLDAVCDELDAKRQPKV
jgi:hypothetical protein